MKKRIVLLLGMTLLFQNCSENDTSDLYSIEESVDKRDSLFDNFDDSFVKAKLRVDWGRYSSQVSETGRETREYRTFSDTYQTLSQGDQEIRLKYTVLATKDKDSEIWDYTILKYLAGDSKSLQQVSYFEKNNYSGPLYFYNLSGGTVAIEGYTKGVLASEFRDAEKGIITQTSKVPDVGCEGPACDGNPGGTGVWVPMTTLYYIDTFQIFQNSSGEVYGYSYYYSTKERQKTEFVWASTGDPIPSSNQPHHSHVQEAGGPRIGFNPHPVEIIDEKLKEDSKEKCIHDKMKKSTGNYISGVMGWFKGDSEFSIHIESVTSLSGAIRGNTSYFGNGIIQIKISSNAANSDSSLEVARTILHEYVHAEMTRKIYTKLALTTPQDLRFLETYRSFKANGFEPSPQHQTMAELYVNSIAEGLESFHKNELKADYDKYTNYFGSKPTSDFYRALAWQGLSSKGVKAWIDLSEADKVKITNLQARTGTLTKACN